MLPPSIGAIIECQTDSRLRTLADIRYLVKESGGTVTPTNHLFDKRGKIVFSNATRIPEQDVFDQAIEAGALDISNTDIDKVEVFTDPGETTTIAKTLSNSLDLTVDSAEIIWVPKEEMKVEMKEGEQASQLDRFLGM